MMAMTLQLCSMYAYSRGKAEETVAFPEDAPETRVISVA